jgi:hypothetical protein
MGSNGPGDSKIRQVRTVRWNSATRINSALFLIVSLIAVTFATAGAEQGNRKDFKMKRELTSGYAPVNGLKVYYEIHGVAGGKNPPMPAGQ